MDNRKTFLDVLPLCNQNIQDFKLDHVNGTVYVLQTGAKMSTTFYPPGSNAVELAPYQRFFYRAMSSEDAYQWLEWLYEPENTPFPLDRNDPLCLASFPGYSINYLKKDHVLIEFFAPSFASAVFDSDRTKNKIYGLKSEGSKDFSWGLSSKCQMSYDGNKSKKLIDDLPQIFKNAIFNGGSFKVVAYRI